MLISASRRTDIPAFFPEWFVNRVKEGYFYRVNPFNKKQISRFGLEPGQVDAFIFWTKNPQPLMKYLSFLDDKGYHYYFQYTLNDYPKLFEPNVPDIDTKMKTFKELSHLVGKERVIWRYDPIIISSISDIDFQINNFNKIAKALSGYTARVVISFVDSYRKVNSRWKDLTLNHQLSFWDITDPAYIIELEKLITHFKLAADENGLDIYTCAEHIDLDLWGVKHGACIDISYINSVFDLNLKPNMDKNQRSECLCAASVDMGIYNTCKHACSYCYANLSEKTVAKNLLRHNINSPILIGN